MDRQQANDRLQALKDGVANVDLYVFESSVTMTADGRQQIHFHLSMPATQLADKDLDSSDQAWSGFGAVAAQLTFFAEREKLTRKMRKAVGALVKKVFK